MSRAKALAKAHGTEAILRGEVVVHLCDERALVWVCEKGHIDDGHLSLDDVEERCSRCGGLVAEYSLAQLACSVPQYRSNRGMP